MYRTILTHFALAVIFGATIALAIAVFPKPAAAEMCVPETQTKVVVAAVFGCCPCNLALPARKKLFQTYERHRTPDCGWTDWQFVRSDIYCVVDWGCCLPQA